jgi:hypothetical protein
VPLPIFMGCHPVPQPKWSGDGGAPQGATGAEVVDTGPRLGDSARSLLQDLVMHGVGAGVLGSVATGDAALAPGSSSVVSPRVSGLYLPGSPDAPPPPINWRQVEDEAESACSQVTIVKRLLYETLASVHRNTLHPVRVSLKRETKPCLHSHGLLHAFSFLLCFVCVALVLG